MALMRAVGAGELDRLGPLYERHHGKVYGLCLQMTGRPEDADDLTQETFLRVLRYRQSFRGAASFTTWLYRIARNLCLDHLRSTRRGERLREEAALEAMPADDAGSPPTGRVARLKRALAGLPIEKREMIILVRFHGLSYGELAEVLQCSVGAARVRVHRAIRELRDIVTRAEETNHAL